MNDSGLINIPLNTWPVPLGDVHRALSNVNFAAADGAEQRALERARFRLGWELDVDALDFVFGAGGTTEPRVIRTFEETLRADAEGFAKLAWLGERFAFNLTGTYAADPVDGDDFRPDGSYVGVAIGNWMVTAGWQDRWYGPGRDGNLILSSNARPTPGIMLQRNNSLPFETRWLHWLGPWSLTTFMSRLDDERVVNDALLFGIRGTFKPIPALEIGITRTAQWCGDDRPCDFSAFVDLLVGNDNRGVNVDPAEEPGNQLGGVDLRWRLPANVPAAVYLQWVGEDGAPGGQRFLGSWLRQAGLEHWGSIGESDYRMHFELADTACHEGGYGFGDIKPNCSYRHGVYVTGYRYKERALAHSADGDSLTWSAGATLVQSGGQTWNATLRSMEINRVGDPDGSHSLSATPVEVRDFYLTYDRDSAYGRFFVGLGVQDNNLSGDDDTEVSGFLQWSSR